MRASSRSEPRSAEVTVRAPGLRTPRIVMHMCSALEHHPHAPRPELLLEPVGDLHRHPLLQLQIPREASTTRASFEIPMILSPGM